MRAAPLSIVCTILLIAPAASAGPPTKAGKWPSPPAWWVNGLGHCIAVHESGNGTTTRNIYGMLAGWVVAGGTGWAGSASRAEQTYRAWLLYKRAGCHEPWGQYDGCC